MFKNELVYCFLLTTIFSFSQITNDSLILKFNLKWRNENLNLNHNYFSNTDTLQITKLKFYVANIVLSNEKNIVYKENKSHLIDIENKQFVKLPIYKASKKEINKISFCIGVDSLTSVSGAMADDLDATNGMYWAWQSGFINLKIEGKSNSCSTRNNVFEFHIGGYKKPNYAIRKTEFFLNKIPLTSESLEIPIDVDFSKLFDEIVLKKTNSVIIPGEEALKIANLSVKVFSSK